LDDIVMPEAGFPRTLVILLLAVVAGIAGGAGGMQFGQTLSYAIAWLTDHDIAELKDMLIASAIAGLAIGAAAGFWIIVALSPFQRWVQRSALAVLVISVLGGTAMMVAAYDWPKDAGHPVVRYELRLPPGVALPPAGEIRLAQWQGKSGHGIYIDRTEMVDGRGQISGSFAIDRKSEGADIALGWAPNVESRWRIPYKGDAKLEKDFGPWHRIEFLPSPRAGIMPLPEGEYLIRYRVRRYM
jgi:hypothetical protein